MKWWERLRCRFTDHEMVALIKWSPEGICLHFVCNKCHKELGHLDIPVTAKKEVIH